MPRRKFIDKKTATTFQLVHRAQNDPLIHDENVSSMVFAEKQQSRRPSEDDYAYSSNQSVVSGSDYRSKHTKQRGDLEEEFGMSFRKNEGEAAQHGVFFDDTDYDYMQHMRDIGTGDGAVTWVEAQAPDSQKKKGKVRLEDALRDMNLDDSKSVKTTSTADSSVARSLLPEEVLPSEFVRRTTYQDQQDVPDEIAGLQPDMDPRLREVLEALDDEEYVEEDDDVFGEIIDDGYEVERHEWDRLAEQGVFDNEEDDEGWESDNTVKAPATPPPVSTELTLPDGGVALPPSDVQAQPPSDPTGGAWLDEFKKFKSAAKAKNAAEPSLAPTSPSARDASVLQSLASGTRKKRKGAKTNPTNYSMTSSTLFRTEQQRLLDARFDQMEAMYTHAEFPEEDGEADGLDNASAMSGMTGISKASRKSKYSNVSGLSGFSGISSYSRAADSEAPKLVRADFDSIVDDFLGSHSKVGKYGNRVRRGAPQTGMEQLDEVRAGLGPARFSGHGRKTT